MKILKSVILACTLLVSSFTFTNIADDINANLSMEQVFSNAAAEGLSMTAIFEQISAADPTQLEAAASYAITNNLASVSAITTIALQVAPQNQLLAIANVARENGASEGDLLTISLAAGVSPTDVAQPTAAGGNPAPGGAPAAPATANAPSPSFGGVGGGGGGGTASPS